MKILYKAETLLLLLAGVFSILYITDLLKSDWVLNVVLIMAVLFHILYAVAAFLRKRKLKAFLLAIAGIIYAAVCIYINFL